MLIGETGLERYPLVGATGFDHGLLVGEVGLLSELRSEFLRLEQRLEIGEPEGLGVCLVGEPCPLPVGGGELRCLVDGLLIPRLRLHLGGAIPLELLLRVLERALHAAGNDSVALVCEVPRCGGFSHRLPGAAERTGLDGTGIA